MSEQAETRQNKFSFSPDDLAVARLLKERDITYKVGYMGVEYDDKPSDPRNPRFPQWDRYEVLFYREHGKTVLQMRCPYRAGLGHRAHVRLGRDAEWTRALGIDKALEREEDLVVIPDRLVLEDERKWGREDHRYIEVMRQKGFAFRARVVLIYPTAASVLYCLMSDAHLGTQTHREFCQNLGYDEDSRKAFDIYMSCQRTHNELVPVLGDVWEPLETLLENY